MAEVEQLMANEDITLLVTQLRNLASDRKNREILAKNKTNIEALVLFADHKNVNVSIIALEGLQYLSECQSNHSIMREIIGLMETMQDIVSRPNCDSKAKELASSIYMSLTATPLKETGNKQEPPTSQHTANKLKKTKRQFFLGAGNKKNKTITLFIRGLNDKNCRSSCEEQLLQVKGLISITFDMNKKHCIVRTRNEVKPETLILSVAKSKTMTAQQVIKNEYGEEVVLSFGTNPTMANKENKDVPQYLPEDDSPIKEKAVARSGEEGNLNQGGWFSTAANFISQSLYW